VPPPGGFGTMIRIDFTGYACPIAGDTAKIDNAANTTTPNADALVMTPPPSHGLLFVSIFL
jgi:hypothetical protein